MKANLVIDTLVFDKAQITSKANGNRPEWGGCCHTISAGNAEQATVIIKYEEDSDMPCHDSTKRRNDER